MNKQHEKKLQSIRIADEIAYTTSDSVEPTWGTVNGWVTVGDEPAMWVAVPVGNRKTIKQIYLRDVVACRRRLEDKVIRFTRPKKTPNKEIEPGV